LGCVAGAPRFGAVWCGAAVTVECCTSEDDGGRGTARASVEGCMALLLPWAAAFELLVPTAGLRPCVVAGGRAPLCVVAEAEVADAGRPATSLFPLFAVGGRCTANGALLAAGLELFMAPALAGGAVRIVGALSRAIMVGGGVARVTGLRFAAEAGGIALSRGCCPPSIELRVGVRLTVRITGACSSAELGTARPAWFIARPLAMALPGAAVTAPFTVRFT